MKRKFWLAGLTVSAMAFATSCGGAGDPVANGADPSARELAQVEGVAQDSSGLPASVRSVYRDVTPAQASSLIRRHAHDPDFVILDVRTPAEYAAGHLQNAVNLDFYASDFDAKLGAWSRNRTYLIYCRTGGRSGKTFEKMKALEFERVYNLLGGIERWKAEGYPVVQ